MGNNEWVVLRCREGFEDTVCERLTEILRNRPYTPFVPSFDYPYRRRGAFTKEKRNCFPGFVFIEVHNIGGGTRTEKEILDEVTQELFPAANALEHSRFFLYTDGDKKHVFMPKRERELLQSVLNNEYRITASNGYRNADGKLVVTSGGLVGHDDKIVGYHKGHRIATIELKFAESLAQIHIMFELVPKPAGLDIMDSGVEDR